MCRSSERVFRWEFNGVFRQSNHELLESLMDLERCQQLVISLVVSTKFGFNNVPYGSAALIAWHGGHVSDAP